MRRWPREQWPPFTNALMKAIEDAGWHDIEDQNGTGTDGHFPLVINNTLDGQRISAARGYLTRDVRARGNLTILSNTTATRLIFDGRRVTGIAGLREGQPFEASGGEVILSMGAIHSPTFLLRNGIGPARHLRDLESTYGSTAPASAAICRSIRELISARL